jgi:hypothetical protein
MSKPGACISLGDSSQGGLQRLEDRPHRACLGGAQSGVDSRPALLKRVAIGRVRRSVFPPRTVGLKGRFPRRAFVPRQLLPPHPIPRGEGGAQHFSEGGRKNLALPPPSPTPGALTPLPPKAALMVRGGPEGRGTAAPTRGPGVARPNRRVSPQVIPVSASNFRRARTQRATRCPEAARHGFTRGVARSLSGSACVCAGRAPAAPPGPSGAGGRWPPPPSPRAHITPLPARQAAGPLALGSGLPCLSAPVGVPRRVAARPPCRSAALAARASRSTTH